jgi:chloramphenicol-sensitive protein RarD
VNDRARAGVLYAGTAFFIWGVVPLYFRALRAVSPYEIIAHRVLWSAVFATALLAVTRGFARLRAALGDRALLLRLALTSALVTSNWLTFVWAVNQGRVLETALGYYITPQVNMLLGMVFLRERLRPAQWAAVALAVAGVAVQVSLVGRLPWISLVLGVTFGSYGLLRKQTAVDPLTGMVVETAIATPVALAYLLWLWQRGALYFMHHERTTDALLMFLGVVTAIPLMLFAAGAQRLRLTTIGFMQYLAPSMAFVLAVFVFREPFGFGQTLTFVFIWTAIAVYSLDGWRAYAGRRAI